jgi:hypothetical protein
MFSVTLELKLRETGGMARRKKRGPKRKRGPRYPCGKLKLVRANPLDDGASSFDQAVKYWGDLKKHVIKLASDQRFGSVLGQLEIYGILTPTQAAAGQRYAAIVGRYERLKGFCRRNASSADFLRGFSSNDPNLRNDEELDDLVRRAREDYNKLRLLVPPYPSVAHRIIDEVCCNDRHVESSDYPDLISVLNKLAKGLRLDLKSGRGIGVAVSLRAPDELKV